MSVVRFSINSTRRRRRYETKKKTKNKNTPGRRDENDSNYFPLPRLLTVHEFDSDIYVQRYTGENVLATNATPQRLDTTGTRAPCYQTISVIFSSVHLTAGRLYYPRCFPNGRSSSDDGKWAEKNPEKTPKRNVSASPAPAKLPTYHRPCRFRHSFANLFRALGIVGPFVQRLTGGARYIHRLLFEMAIAAP